VVTFLLKAYSVRWLVLRTSSRFRPFGYVFFWGPRFGVDCFRSRVGGSQDFGFYSESRLGNRVWPSLSSSSSVGVVVLRGFVRLRLLPEGSAIVRCPSVGAGAACVVCPLAWGGGG
jgi:hypothetical protein